MKRKNLRPMTEAKFRKLKKGDKIHADINGKVVRETCVADAFFNHDCDEPGWEVETRNGFFSIDGVYYEEVDEA